MPQSASGDSYKGVFRRSHAGDNPVNFADPFGLIAAGSVGAFQGGYQGPKPNALNKLLAASAVLVSGIAVTPLGIPLMTSPLDAFLASVGMFGEAAETELLADGAALLGTFLGGLEVGDDFDEFMNELAREKDKSKHDKSDNQDDCK